MESFKQKLTLIQHSAAVSQEEKKEISKSSPRDRQIDQSEVTGHHKTLSKSQLINKLNFINFQEATISLRFKHIKYDRYLNLEAKPLPCADDMLDCVWVDSEGIAEKLKSFEFDRIYISDSQRLILVKPELTGIHPQGACFKLPETGVLVSNRKVMRYPCEGINVQLIQNSSIFRGTLTFFNSFSFHVELTTQPPQTFKWINPESFVELIISDEKETIFSGRCRIIKETSGQKNRNYILEPLTEQINRFKHKEFRSSRQQLNPAPEIIFVHPIAKNVVSLKAFDVSGSGFSVEEDLHSALLVPGMIIPELELNFGINFKIQCRAQVVYRKIYQKEKEGEIVKCGLTLLDIDIQHHARLLALLHHAENKISYVCNTVDMNALWDFFFETGFIYPDKYEYIQRNKEKIKETYEKLYTQNPNIARHFICQDKGQILAHMAMVRFFENSWLIHHHAARKTALNRAGLVVLNQIGNFTYDSHRLYSLHMDFLMAFFRPDNKFPNRVFGGATKAIDNRKASSLDMFAYFHLHKRRDDNLKFGAAWQLVVSSDNHLDDLQDFYEYTSGGLLLNAMDLEAGLYKSKDLTEEYARVDLKREKNYFSLLKKDQLKAFFFSIQTEIGLNLSNLTNCIVVFILDASDLPPEILHSALSQVMHQLDAFDQPVMLFPHTYSELYGLPAEKFYKLWILNTAYSDLYFSFVNRLLRYAK